MATFTIPKNLGKVKVAMGLGNVYMVLERQAGPRRILHPLPHPQAGGGGGEDHQQQQHTERLRC